MSTADAPRADAGGVAALGAASSRLFLWVVLPIPREQLCLRVYTNVSGVTMRYIQYRCTNMLHLYSGWQYGTRPAALGTHSSGDQ